MGKPPREDERQRSSLSAIINKRILDGVIEKKRDRKPQQKSELDRQLRSIFTKIDKGNVKAGIRMAVGEDKIADFTVDNYDALKLKHPERETCSVPDPRDIDCFSTWEFFVHKALMFFPNGSSAGLDGISPQILKDLTANSNGHTGLNFLRALANLLNVILEGKEISAFRTSAVHVWCETNGATKARSRTLSYRCRQFLLAIIPQKVPNTMSSNHVKQDIEIDKLV